jgi:hypothetical protein
MSILLRLPKFCPGCGKKLNWNLIAEKTIGFDSNTGQANKILYFQSSEIPAKTKRSLGRIIFGGGNYYTKSGQHEAEMWSEFKSKANIACPIKDLHPTTGI